MNNWQTLGWGNRARVTRRFLRGPIICGKQSVHLVVEAFGAEREIFTPDQVEEVAVKEILLQRAPRMFMEVTEERTERDRALAVAVDGACQHGLVPEFGERLCRVVLERYL